MHAESRRLLGTPVPVVRRLGLVIHPTRDVREPLARVARWARGAGVQAVIAAPAVRGPLPPGIDPVPAASLARPDTVLLALGGDGTMLHALALGAPCGAPVLGVALGHVSFLAAVDAGALDRALDALAAGCFALEDRTLLEVRHYGRAELAVNDLVLRRTAAGSLADVEVRVAGDAIARHRGDGVIVSTPTGSTGYSRSAGGPLLSPRLPVTLITPLASQGAAPPAVVLPATEPVELRVGAESAVLAVELDGVGREAAAPGVRIRIGEAARCGRLVRLPGSRSPLAELTRRASAG